MATPLFEDSPAYTVLSGHNLLETKYRLRDPSEITARAANSDAWTPSLLSCASCFLPPICGYFAYKKYTTSFEVNNGQLRKLEDGRGNFEFAGPGIHLIADPFVRETGQIDLGREVRCFSLRDTKTDEGRANTTLFGRLPSKAQRHVTVRGRRGGTAHVCAWQSYRLQR